MLVGVDSRVRAHAAACLTNFFQNASAEHFGEHLAEPMEALLRAYYRGPLAVQENVLGTLSEYTPVSYTHLTLPTKRIV